MKKVGVVGTSENLSLGKILNRGIEVRRMNVQ